MNLKYEGPTIGTTTLSPFASAAPPSVAACAACSTARGSPGSGAGAGAPF